MLRRKRFPMLFAASALSLAAMTPNATTASAQNAPQVYDSQLMTPQERFEHRQRLKTATTAEDRARIRAEHHQEMQERAKEMGVTLPKTPPAQGLGQGRGTDRGQGLGSDKGRGRGMGQSGG